MNEMLEKLWNEYFSEECAVIATDEEKALAKKAIDLHEAASRSLTKEQSEAVEKHVEALLELQSAFLKKAFFKGCEFATAFLCKAGICGKN